MHETMRQRLAAIISDKCYVGHMTAYDAVEAILVAMENPTYEMRKVSDFAVAERDYPEMIRAARRGTS